MSSVKSQQGFTMIELLIAIMLMSLGIMAFLGTFDVARRVTTLSEMKEVASHTAQQHLERLRSLSYKKLALTATPSPQSSSDPTQPAYYVSGQTFAVDATNGQVSPALETWTDGRISGTVQRYVTWVDDPSAAPTANCTGAACTQDYKRVTVVVTVSNAGGPSKPIVAQALMSDASDAIGQSANPLADPNTKCVENGQLIDCVRTIDGTVTLFYLYDTAAANATRQDIVASHATHPTVAAPGSCPASCIVPDLMGVDAPPSPGVTPPVYNYSNEITGGTWPGGAVVRRDTTCAGTPTSTDNTKGHMWVTAPLAAAKTLTGAAALNLSTATFNAVSAEVTLCVRFYDVPNSISNLVSSPPTVIGSGSYHQSSWPRNANTVGFTIDDFRAGAGNYTIAQGRRLGVRIWPESTSGADIAVLYDHPTHPSFVQINEAG